MPARTKIIKKTLRGISKAQEDYEAWSTLWLWEAPEYMITTYIAKEIAADYFVTLEQDAGELKPGQGGTSERTRRKLDGGRFDIVVWDDYDPVTIIEVKNQPVGFSNISGDVENICRMVKGDNSLEYGLVAYYLGLAEKTDDESAKKRTLGRVEEIRANADAHIRGLKLRQHLSHPKPQVVEDSAWIGVVLQISSP